MKKEVRGGVSLVLASAMLVASPMAAGMTETVQAEELTVDSKVAQIQGESIIPRADQVPGNEELFALPGCETSPFPPQHPFRQRLPETQAENRGCG